MARGARANARISLPARRGRLLLCRPGLLPSTQKCWRFAVEVKRAPSVPCAAGAGVLSQCSILPVAKPTAMDPLIEGYRRFRAEVWPAEKARYEALAHWGQSPEAMVVACSDSRVDPQTMFSACRANCSSYATSLRSCRHIVPTPDITEPARRWNSASRS